MFLSGKAAIVTGGSRGIGRAICVKLAKEGANVIINYAGNEAGALETKAQCENENNDGKFVIYKADVSNFEECESMFKACEQELGALDILINNAGITKDNLIPRMSLEDFESVIDTNLKGAFNCVKLAYKPMTKKRAGRIVNITSVVGINGNAGQANYSASKAGLIGLTKSTAKELAKRNITVNAIAPGFIGSDMTDKLSETVKENILKLIPLGKIGNPEDVAEMAAFLCGDMSSYITGQVINVDGGMAM